MCKRRHLILMAIVAISVLLLAALPMAGQADDAEGRVRLKRTLSTAYAVPGSTFRVKLLIEPQEDLEGVGIREVLPFGWEVHPVETEGAVFKRSDNEWVFTDRMSEGSTIELVYEIAVPPADRLYAATLPTCFEITGTFQATVPTFEAPIPGDSTVEIVTALPIPTAVAHLIPGALGEPDRIDLRLDKHITRAQLNRALQYWSTDSAVPWTEGEIIDLATMERLTALYEACMEADELLPLSIDPELVAVRTIKTFLPCDSVLLPEGCLDPGLSARQFSVTVEIIGSHDAYGVGLAEWFPETWRVTPVEHRGFTYRASRAEWIYADRLPAGQTVTVSYLVEVIASTTDHLSTFSGCCGAPAAFIGTVSSGLECSARKVIGESEAYVWQCLPVLLAISRWDVEEDRLDAKLSDSISFPQVQRAIEFWLSSTAVPHTCGYTVGYHMLKRIIAYWLAGVPVTNPLPEEATVRCEEDDDCYAPSCPDGGLCHLLELQRVEDHVGIPDVPRVAVNVEGSRELTCRMQTTTLHAVVAGGTPPYQYEWWGQGGELLGTADRLQVSEPGSYTAVVLSVGGCRVGQQVRITQDIEAPQVSVNVGSVIGCAASEIMLTATILGGRPPFEVRWFGETGELLGKGSQLAVDAPGRFTVLVEGANGCSGHAAAAVLEDVAPPTVNAGPDRALTCAQTDVSLEGTATGGHEPYVYRWTNEDGATISTEPSAEVDTPGTYLLTVTGANGCSGSDEIHVELNTDPPIAELAASGPITCADSSVTLVATVNGGPAPVLVTWLDPYGAVIAWTHQIDVAQAGTYTVLVEGANGCVIKESIAVADDMEAPAVDAVTSGPLTCATRRVELRAVVAGGRSPYAFAWIDEDDRILATTETVFVAQPGTYEVIVTGANGCTANDTVQVSQDVEPPVVTASVSGVLSCRTSSVTLSATIGGGRAPYDIAWTNTSGSPLGTSKTITVGEPGAYQVTATGANGCAATASVTVEQDLVPPSVEAAVSARLTCDVLKVSLTATIGGGRAPYSIAWADASGSPLGTSKTITVDEPGAYQVTATGGNGCTATATVTVEQDIAAPIIEASASASELTCTVTEVTLSAEITGGTGPYSVVWSDGSGGILANTPNVIVDQPGTYRATVTGGNGCAGSDTLILTVDREPPTVEATASGELSCATPEVRLTAVVSDGRAPYTCVWSDCCGTKVGIGREILVSSPGVYVVNVTGENGCAASALVEVGEDRAPPTVDVTVSGALSCFVGQVTLTTTVSDGRGPYAILWSNPDGTIISSRATVEVCEPGVYTVSAMGQNGCLTSVAVVVAEDVAPPTVDLGPDRVLTCAEPEIVLFAPLSGGTGPFTYHWADHSGNMLSSGPELYVTSPGIYVVTVTGANGCSISDFVAVHDGINAPTVYLGPDRELGCCGATTVLLPEITGGAAPYSYAWYNECDVVIGSKSTLTVTQPGVYLLIVRTVDGCIASDSVIVREPSP